VYAGSMSHELELRTDGTAKFAYADREIPWHRLGKPMSGLQTAEAMLIAAEADYDVVLARVAAVDEEDNLILNPDGTPVIVEDSRATLRSNSDGTFDGLATVGTRYTVAQNRECLDYALAIVGASRGDAVVDTCGVLHEGRQFFACLDLGSLVIDPIGINDQLERYLLVHTGHDGKIAITYANTAIRSVCKNTINLATGQARAIFTAKHTRNAGSTVEQAQEVLGISTHWAEKFQETATQLLSTPIMAGSRQFDGLLDAVFPPKSTETNKQKANRMDVNRSVRRLYTSDRNAGGYGYNAWSAYNSVAEYLDHAREAEARDRALASMSHNSWVSSKKIVAEQYLLSLV
jgi:phage/plasmid-like protein (TIGR03299 family)